MQLAIKATCAETIQFSLLHELSPFRCDPKPGKTCSTSSRSGANSTHVTNGFDLAVATPVFPHWVNRKVLYVKLLYVKFVRVKFVCVKFVCVKLFVC